MSRFGKRFTIAELNERLGTKAITFTFDYTNGEQLVEVLHWEPDPPPSRVLKDFTCACGHTWQDGYAIVCPKCGALHPKETPCSPKP